MGQRAKDLTSQTLDIVCLGHLGKGIDKEAPSHLQLCTAASFPLIIVVIILQSNKLRHHLFCLGFK